MFGLSFIKTKDFNDLKESMNIYKRALEDLGWENLSSPLGVKNFTKQNIHEIIRDCKVVWYNNPIAGLWTQLTTSFVFGEGIDMPISKEPQIQEVIKEFWEDQDNILALTGYQAQQDLCHKLQYEGNLFILMFDDDEGSVRCRIINSEDIVDVIKNNDDKLRPDFYKVKVIESEYNMDSDSYTFRDVKYGYYMDRDFIAGETGLHPKVITEGRILHIKVNCDINDKFGIPLLYRGLPWIRAHKDMAQDVATLIKALSQFAWKKKIKGNSKVVNAIRNLTQSTTNLKNIGPATASTQIENEGVDLQSIDVKTGGVDIGSKGLREMKLMISAASGIYEHYWGDPSTGNLATAKTMELPMVKKFLAMQKLFEHLYNEILQYTINKKIEVGILSGGAELNIKTNRIVYSTDLDRTIDIDFPPILETDLKELAEGLNAATLGNLVSGETAARMFLTGTNQNNIDEEVEKIFGDGGELEQKQDFQREQFGMNKEETSEEENKEKINEDDKQVKEAVETPTKKIAERLVRKNKYLDQRMNGYRKSLAADLNRFIREMKNNIKVTSYQDTFLGDVENIDALIEKLINNMDKSAQRYFPVAVDIGTRFAISELRGNNIKVKEANTDFILQEKLQWNRGFVENSLGIAITEKLQKLSKQSYKSEKAFKDAVTEAGKTFESRVEQYVGAFWTVEEAAVKEVLKDHDVWVNFAGADDDGTCEGCKTAMEGNPYPINEAPEPGTFECYGRCRHALQITNPPTNR